MDNCNVVKGFFLILVFIRHFLQYKPIFVETPGHDLILMINGKLGQLIVALFLFYSGYGVMVSAIRKGSSYVRALPRRRILPTWISFAAAVAVYAAVTIGIGLYKPELRRILLSMIGWKSYGNSNWYIFCVLLLYLAHWIAMSLAGTGNCSVAVLCVLTGLYVLVVSGYKDSYWWNTAFCYAAGCAWAVNKDRIDALLDRVSFGSPVGSLFFFIATRLLWQNRAVSEYLYLLCSVCFAVGVVLLSRCITIESPFLLWAGRNLYPLFIFQRLPMILLQKKLVGHGFYYFIICLLLTLLTAPAYNQISRWIIRRCKSSRS
ncbi:MAG: hypothetical protein Q4B09_10450 [Lachnospiraceae bacterium]|nr:hypothetical protein [Lachnospiraceae bacterium]